MRTLTNWHDLEPYGIYLLTGEACGLMYRFLCDLDPAGKRIVEKLFGTGELALPEPWNRGTEDRPHVASILVPPNLLLPLSVFCLLEGGCREVYSLPGGGAVGIEPTDSPSEVATFKQMYADRLGRRFAYEGTAGDRNIHHMSGRVR